MLLSIFVPGVPQPQGSSRAFRSGSKIVVTSANPKLKAWRREITEAVREEAASQGLAAWEGRARLHLTFILPRPASHLTSKGALTKSAPRSHLSTPDLDKLVRAVGDGITDAGVWRDDSQVISIRAEKHYQNTFADPGATIIIELLKDEEHGTL